MGISDISFKRFECRLVCIALSLVPPLRCLLHPFLRLEMCSGFTRLLQSRLLEFQSSILLLHRFWTLMVPAVLTLRGLSHCKYPLDLSITNTISVCKCNTYFIAAVLNTKQSLIFLALCSLPLNSEIWLKYTPYRCAKYCSQLFTYQE